MYIEWWINNNRNGNIVGSFYIIVDCICLSHVHGKPLMEMEILLFFSFHVGNHYRWMLTVRNDQCIRKYHHRNSSKKSVILRKQSKWNYKKLKIIDFAPKSIAKMSYRAESNLSNVFVSIFFSADKRLMPISGMIVPDMSQHTHSVVVCAPLPTVSGQLTIRQTSDWANLEKCVKKCWQFWQTRSSYLINSSSGQHIVIHQRKMGWFNLD